MMPTTKTLLEHRTNLTQEVTRKHDRRFAMMYMKTGLFLPRVFKPFYILPLLQIAQTQFCNGYSF